MWSGSGSGGPLLHKPIDTAIPNKHDFIFIKEVYTINWVLYLGGGGGGQCHKRIFVLGEGWDEDVTKLEFFTFDLFTLSISIH